MKNNGQGAVGRWREKGPVPRAVGCVLSVPRFYHPLHARTYYAQPELTQMSDKKLDPIEALKGAKSSAELQAPSVIMSEGDILIGTVDAFSTGWSNEKNDAGEIQGEYPIVLIHVEEAVLADKDSAKVASPGEVVAVHAFHKVLRSQMAKANIRPGLRIGIRRFADTKAKDGRRTYADWTVVRSDQSDSSSQSFNERFGS